MIRSLRATNQQGETLDLELTRPDLSGYEIRGIDGLFPPAATINTATGAGFDGEFFNSSRVGMRNIVLTLGLRAMPTIEQKRVELYRYFPVKKKVSIQIETDTRIGWIEGYVESHETPIFTENEEAQISILCPFPYFQNPTTTIERFYGIEPRFEFPFENASTTVPLLEMGSYVKIIERDIFNPGDDDTGLTIRVAMKGAIGDLMIYNASNPLSPGFIIYQADVEVYSNRPIGAGDEIIITTSRGKKSIKLLQDGEYIDLLPVLGITTDWLTAPPGLSRFGIAVTSGPEFVEMTIEYNTLYSGV